ncbi:MAG: alanyl-tRNA editing protein [Sphaerochaetaceae bacterium]|nr:alanyl-tRNA editing protein [Sphaerochaetaceae bacterium]
MREQHYYDEPYLKEYNSKVISVLDRGIILESTISYAEGGGQPGDRGAINGIPYTNTLHEGDHIIHLIDSSSFNVGDEVVIKLDWAHRYDYMQQHTAQHLLSGLMFTKFGIGTLSVHQGEDILTIETDRMDIPEETLLTLETEANRAICENHPVKYLELSHEEAEKLGMRRSIKVEGDVRVVVIEGVDKIACGGLHTATTGEIGEISFAGSELIRNHVRTIWRTGNRAVRERRANAQVIKELSKQLSSPRENLSSSVASLSEQISKLKYQLSTLEKEVARNLLNRGEAVFTSSVPLASYQDLDADRDYAVIYINGDRLNWLLRSEKPEAFASFRKSFSSLGVKGGGRGPIYQGSGSIEKKEELINLFKELLNE